MRNMNIKLHRLPSSRRYDSPQPFIAESTA